MAATATETKSKAARPGAMSVAMIGRLPLIDALEAVGAIVPTRSHQPVLQCVRLVTGENNAAHIEATDLQSFIKIPLPVVQVESQADLLIKHDDFLRAVKACDGETLSLRCDDNALHVIGSDSKHVIQLTEKSKFPQPSQVDGRRFAVSGADLVRMFKQTSHAQGAGVLKTFACHGRNLVFENGRVVMKGTDLSSLAVASAKCADAKEKVGAIIPDACGKIIDSLVATDDAEVEVALEDNRVRLACDGTEFTSCLLEGGIVPELPVADGYAEIEVGRESFLSAVQRASVFSDGLTGLAITFTNRGATLAMNTKANSADVSYPLKFNGESFTVFIGHDRLIGALRAARGEAVRIDVLSPIKTVFVRELKSAGDAYYCAINPRNERAAS